MNLKRQLLLVSLLTLVLPWAGCQFIRETESALRAGQQQMLSGTASAIAESLAQYEDEFPLPAEASGSADDSLYGHRIATRPNVDGYFDDWNLDRAALRNLDEASNIAQFAVGLHEQFVYLYVEVQDRQLVYSQPGTTAVNDSSRHADRIGLVNTSPPYLDETFVFGAEAPGSIISYVQNEFGFAPDPSIVASWQDTASGYQLEARIPASRFGTHIGLLIGNTSNAAQAPDITRSYSGDAPGAFVTTSDALTEIVTSRTQYDMRLILTDATGWRIAMSDGLISEEVRSRRDGSAWLRIIYGALVEPGQVAELAEPDPSGLERQDYIVSALNGESSESWFRSDTSGGAVVAVAEPIVAGNAQIGTLVLQQGTDAILSLTNERLAQLIYVTVIATAVVALGLLGFATWLSRRIRRLSKAAEQALENDNLRGKLPSAESGDEVGDLSRSFSYVLRQLGEYNDYLRTLASKLSHELRTPLTIVSSSLENLEHEPLNEKSAEYAARAKSGTERLRRILTAMSEASRVEELMEHADARDFDLHSVLESTVAAYRDAYPDRQFEYSSELVGGIVRGSPELTTQMLDKLVDNAVDFSAEGDKIEIGLRVMETSLEITVTNPGPSLPEKMRSQLFDSMVTVRSGDSDQHLGLGLYVAKLIAEGHNGTIFATNVQGGVRFTVSLPDAS